MSSPSKVGVAPLTGKLRDETGDRLTPTHTKRHGRRLRYYISNRLISGGTDPSGWRLPAVALEQAIANIIAQHLTDLANGHRICVTPDLQLGDAVRTKAEDLTQRLRKGAPILLANITAGGQLAKGRIELELHGAVLATELSLKPDEIDPSALHVQAPFELRRRGVEGKIVAGDPEPEPDRTMLRALARALDAGCKADSVLILEGSQGAGKSTALRMLAGEEWFGDALPQMGTKDASDYLRGKWIVELAELSNINKAEVEIVKAFVSRTEERFRPAYGRSEICYPRQCVFAGTTNKADYLRDETGNRRFWPIKCGKIDADMIKSQREMLWGEAVRAYKSGEKWWLSGQVEEYARIEQENRLSIDEWTGVVANYCEGKIAVGISQIAQGAFEIEIKDVNRQTQNRISAILSTIGYVRDGQFSSGEQRGKARYVRAK